MFTACARNKTQTETETKHRRAGHEMQQSEQQSDRTRVKRCDLHSSDERKAISKEFEESFESKVCGYVALV